MFKKYPNRRIYDTTESRYVTINDIRDSVLGGQAVINKQTGNDITAEVLAGVIIEDNKVGKGPTANELRQFIKAYTKSKVFAKAS